MKTVLYRLFGIGKIQEPLLAELKTEGILLLDESIEVRLRILTFVRRKDTLIGGGNGSPLLLR